ncbi:MAG: hypothetical protein CK532_02710 [Flavobacteriales bacterium]|nr:MAG: hypothetical protein CK532_02710 [Flavobacteriales bacterium]
MALYLNLKDMYLENRPFAYRFAQGVKYSVVFCIVFLCITSPLGAQNTKAKKHLQTANVQFQAAEFSKASISVKKALHADPTFADAYSLQASIYEALHDTLNASKSYRNCLRVAPEYQPMYFYYGEYLYRNKHFKEALYTVQYFDSIPHLKSFIPSKHKASTRLVDKAHRLSASIEIAMEDVNISENLQIQNMGSRINTAQNEYWPGMPFSGDRFVFTRMVDGQEDFYISERVGGVWGKAFAASGTINTAENEGTLSVKADGSALYYSRCNQPGGLGSCDLYVSYLDGSAWQKGDNLGAPVNGSSWDCQPAISGDGHTLVFASARKGGFGGKDLWMSKLTNGAWSNPENLGSTINTKDDDDAPFLHYDGRTLYFSSLGHTGFGGADLHMSRLGMDNQWSIPENLGSVLNTTAEEFGLYIDAVGKTGYFASDRLGGNGGLDIYRFLVPEKFKPKAVTYVSGLLLNAKTKKTIIALVRLIDLSTGKVVFEDSVQDFFIPLFPNVNYALHASAMGFLTQSFNFQPIESSVENPFKVVAKLSPIEPKQLVTLNNIFFDTDKFDIKSESFIELKMVETLMRANPLMAIEVLGHTDNQGSAEYNMRLSGLRASAVIHYLKTQGIDQKRLTSKGYGDTQPVVSNDSDLGRSQNRRIEMRVVKIQ